MRRPSSARTSIRVRVSVRRSSPIAWVAVALLALGSQACTPRCQETCTKVLDCGFESTRVARDECVFSCQDQQSLYASWEDEVKIEAFKEHKRCLASSTCEEIEEGVCYDPEIFIIDGPAASSEG